MVDFNFSRSRLLILLLLLLSFAFLGGFTPPAIPEDLMLNPARVRKAWIYCVMMFVAGACSVSIVDHFVGNIDRSNIRFLYVILGVILMVGSGVYIYTLKNPAPEASGGEAYIE